MKTLTFTAALMCFISISLSGSPLSGTYSIDGYKPASSTNFYTIGDAINALNTNGISGPVIFNLADGTYNESLSMGSISGSSASNTITFQSASGDKSTVIIQNTTSLIAVYISGTSNINFKGITILSTSGNINIYVSHCSNISFQNSVIVNKYKGTGNKGRYGVYVEYSSVNILNNNISTAEGSSKYLDNGIILGYQTGQCFITGNKINLPTGGNGIQIIGCLAAKSAPDRVVNNMITVGCDSQQNNYGIESGSNDNIAFYYNNILLSGHSGSGSVSIIVLSSNASYKISLYNNNFINKAGGYAISAGVGGNIIDADYNNYYASSGIFGKWNNSNYSSLFYWNLDFEIDGHSLSIPAGYYSATDLHVKNFGLKNKGTPVNGISTDIDGDLRDSKVPDIGADEFSPVLHDISLTAILNITPGNNCGDSLNPSLVITNYGYTSESKIPLIVAINGKQIIFRDTIPFIKAGASDTFRLRSVLNTVNGGHYDFRIYTFSATDIDRNNDSIIFSTYFYPNSLPPVINDITVCNSYYVTNSISQYFKLQAIKRNVGDQLYWYHADGTFFGSGDTLFSRRVDSTSVFYVQEQRIFTYSGGYADTSQGKGRFSTSPTGPVIKSKINMLLDSITLYPKKSGTFYMGTSPGNLKKYSVTVSAPGQPVKIHVAWYFSAGSSNTIYFDTILTGGFYCNTMDLNNPGISSDLVTVSRISGDSMYRYIYNMKFIVISPCLSQRAYFTVNYKPIHADFIKIPQFQGTFTSGTYADPDVICGAVAGYGVATIFQDSLYGKTWTILSAAAVSQQNGNIVNGVITAAANNNPAVVSYYGLGSDQSTRYQMKIRIKNIISGCDSTIYTRYCRLDAPYIKITLAGPLCSGTQLFKANISGAAKILWDFGDGGKDTINQPFHTFSVGIDSVKKYLVKLIATGTGGCSRVDSALYTVYGPPNADFSYSIDSFRGVNFYAEDTNLVNYHWDFGDNNFGGDPSCFHRYAGDGSYEVTLLTGNSNNCSNSMTKKITVIKSVGISPVFNDLFALNIFPNPVQNNININYNLTNSSQVSIRLTDMQGKMISMLQPVRNQAPGAYHLSLKLPPGIASGNYLLHLQFNDQEITRELIINGR